MSVRRFDLPTSSPPAFGFGGALVGVAAWSLVAGFAFGGWADFWSAALVWGLFGLSLVGGVFLLVQRDATRARRSPRYVDVGVDGVCLGSRFIPYADVNEVRQATRKRTDVPGYEGTVSIRIGRQLSEVVELVTRLRTPNHSGDPLGVELARAINKARAAWVAGQGSEGLAASLSRGERTGSEWLEALREFGSGAAASYRSAAADVGELSRLLDDPLGKPSARAAAVIMLTAAGDETATAKLRVAAEQILDPRERIALENIADETAVAEALEFLEETDSERSRGLLGSSE